MSLTLPTRLLRTAWPLACAAALLLALPLMAGATPATGSPAPDFTLKSAAGQNLRLGEQKGRVVMVNFWATWCGPCRIELPQLSRLQQKYGDAGFTMLGVNVDDDFSKATAVAQQLDVRFPVLYDDGKQVVKRYGVSAMPSSVLIDRDGRVRAVHLGYRAGDEAAYEDTIRALLKE